MNNNIQGVNLTTAPPVLGSMKDEVGEEMTTPPPDQGEYAETKTVWKGEDNWTSKDDSLESILGKD